MSSNANIDHLKTINALIKVNKRSKQYLDNLVTQPSSNLMVIVLFISIVLFVTFISVVFLMRCSRKNSEEKERLMKNSSTQERRFGLIHMNINPSMSMARRTDYFY